MFITATIADPSADARPTSARSCAPSDRERERVQVDAEPGRDAAARIWPAELLPPAEPAEVVDRADRGRDRRAEQDAAQLAAERQERERGDEHAQEQREPAEPRDLGRARSPSVAAVDEPQVARAEPTAGVSMRTIAKATSAPQMTSGGRSAHPRPRQPTSFRRGDLPHRRGPGRCSRARSGHGRSRRRRSARPGADPRCSGCPRAPR